MFNGEGDCLAAKLRPGNVHSAEEWDQVLLPEIERQQRRANTWLSAPTPPSRSRRFTRRWRRGRSVRDRVPANKNLEWEIADVDSSRGRPSHKPLVRYKSFHYQADSWTKARRVVAKVEHHAGELFPRVGFIVTNLTLANRAVVRFYNKRGTAEQWIQGGEAGGALDATLVSSIPGRTRSACS